MNASNASYYGVSEADGGVYLTNSSFTASGTKQYEIPNLADGTYKLKEYKTIPKFV